MSTTATAEYAALAEIDDWTDHSDEPDRWPYPNRYVRSAPSEHLRLAVIARVAAPLDAKVTLLTTEISGGWSSWTQETDYETQVEVNGKTVYTTAEDWSTEGNLNRLLAWLDEDVLPEDCYDQF